MTPTQRRILAAIETLWPHAYGATIMDRLDADLPQNWMTRRWPILNAFRGISAGRLHVELDRLEIAGLISSELVTESPGDRWRYYFLAYGGTYPLVHSYFLTYAGKCALIDALKSAESSSPAE